MKSGKIENLHGSPTFYALLEEMAKTHDAKSHDYAKDSDPYGNYKFAGWISSLFSHAPDDAGFAGRLAEKIFRLSVLEGGKLTPKNEAIEDTERDIAVIATLWMSARRDARIVQSETAEHKEYHNMPQTPEGAQYQDNIKYTDPKIDPEEEAITAVIKAERDMSPSALLETIKYLNECYHSRVKVTGIPTIS